ncbi:MAG: choice-of-anchor D domain-containing protein [Saprospiraceae bacterium]|nr:choice-of-anchor D domain-containing protein [Saprospiraceae bacterium]
MQNFIHVFAQGLILSLLSCATLSAQVTTVVTNTTDWKLSTVRTSGNNNGTWTTLPASLPATGTFTLTPVLSSTSVPAFVPALSATGFRLDGGINTPTGVQYFRTTFNLDLTAGKVVSSAVLTTLVDNGVQVWINGQEVGQEVSYVTANWATPYPTLTINGDGTISNIQKFDATFPFTNWLNGTNELVLAARNPDNEGFSAGGIAFRMDVTVSTSFIAPEITVTGNSNVIANRSITVSPTDDTDFGPVAVAGSMATHSFTIENMPGSLDLELDGMPRVTVAGRDQADFSVSQPSTGSISGGGSTSFDVTFDPTAPGARSAIIVITHNDLPDNPFVFTVQGEGQ